MRCETEFLGRGCVSKIKWYSMFQGPLCCWYKVSQRFFKKIYKYQQVWITCFPKGWRWAFSLFSDLDGSDRNRIYTSITRIRPHTRICYSCGKQVDEKKIVEYILAESKNDIMLWSSRSCANLLIFNSAANENLCVQNLHD